MFFSKLTSQFLRLLAIRKADEYDFEEIAWINLKRTKYAKFLHGGLGMIILCRFHFIFGSLSLKIRRFINKGYTCTSSKTVYRETFFPLHFVHPYKPRSVFRFGCMRFFCIYFLRIFACTECTESFTLRLLFER
jgi:hypothetical protein